MTAHPRTMMLPFASFAFSPNGLALIIESLSILALIILGGGENVGGDPNPLKDTIQIIGWITVMLCSIAGTFLAGWFLYRSKSNKYLKEDRDNLEHLLISTKLLLAEKENDVLRLERRKDELKTELEEEKADKMRLKGELMLRS